MAIGTGTTGHLVEGPSLFTATSAAVNPATDPATPYAYRSTAAHTGAGPLKEHRPCHPWAGSSVNKWR